MSETSPVELSMSMGARTALLEVHDEMQPIDPPALSRVVPFWT
jgi:hypothetical protein